MVSPSRLAERLFFVGLGYVGCSVVQAYPVPASLLPAYMGIAVLLVGARWMVVSHRNRKDAARLVSGE